MLDMAQPSLVRVQGAVRAAGEVAKPPEKRRGGGVTRELVNGAERSMKSSKNGLDFL
jgi:hypothetical protein